MLSVKLYELQSEMSGDTPKKAVGKRGRKPRETNDISESDFCPICKCTLETNSRGESRIHQYGKYIFEVPEKKGPRSEGSRTSFSKTLD